MSPERQRVEGTEFYKKKKIYISNFKHAKLRITDFSGYVTVILIFTYEQKLVWDVDTYYVGTDGAEGIGATHVEMGAIKPQENFDVIEAIGLDENNVREWSVQILLRNDKQKWQILKHSESQSYLRADFALQPRFYTHVLHQYTFPNIHF